MSLFSFILSIFQLKKSKLFSNTCERDYGIDNVDKLKAIIKERDASLKLAEEISHVGYWEWDIVSNKINLSDEMYRIFGTDKENFDYNLHSIIQNYVQSKYKKLVYNAIKSVTSTSQPQTIELEITRNDGKSSWIRTKGHLVHDRNGKMTKVIGVVQDITEWKETQEILQEKLSFINKLIESIPNPIFYKDENRIYKHCNTAFANYLGLNQDDIIGKTVFDISPRDLAEIYDKADITLMKQKGTQSYDSKIKYSDGMLHDVIFNKAVLTNHKDEVSGIVGVIVDISERKKSEEKINRLLGLKGAMLEINQAIIGINNINELFDLILEKAFQTMKNADLGCILVVDNDRNLRVASCKGYNRENAKDFCIKLEESFVWSITKGNLEKAIIIDDIQNTFSNKFPNILENDNNILVQSSLSAPIIIEGQLFGLINIDSRYNNVYDETDLEIMDYMRNKIAMVVSKHKLYEEIIYLSRYDKLTNVYNRRHFEVLINDYIQSSQKKGEKFSYVMFDLDGLKSINDNFGHLAGDEVIKTFTINLKKCMRYSDILARIGGDEFVAVVFKTDLLPLIKKFEALASDFNNNPILFENNKIVCSFSYGIAEFPRDGYMYDQLAKISDQRMYDYKRKKKMAVQKTLRTN